ncbi:MAG: outer membrane beta-barrel protein [Pseudomonadota bacterium]
MNNRAPHGARAATAGAFMSLTIALGAVSPAIAAEWFLETTADVTGTYDDNIRLDPDNNEDVFGVIVAPVLDLHGRGQNWDVIFTTDLALGRYTEDSSLDSEDVRFLLDTSYRTQRNEFGLNAEASRVSTLYTESTDSGDFDANADRDLFSFEPYWSHQLSERDFLNFGGGYTIANFDTDELEDFEQFYGTAGYARKVTQADLVSLNLSAVGFISKQEDPVNVDLDSQLYSVTVGWERDFSERLRTNLVVGPRYYTTEQVGPGPGNPIVDDDSFGFIFEAEVEYDLDERTTMSLLARHDVDPTSGGTPVQRNAVEFDASHQFLPRWFGGLNLYFQVDDDPNGGSDSNQDRNFLSVEPQITYQVLQELDLQASYRFRTQKEDSEDRAYSNAVFVSLIYRLPKWTFGH